MAGNATYDTATANMGAPWKMFTQTQGQELISNTTSEWTSMNGVTGRKFTSKSNPNKYIFLPAGGNWYDTTHNYIGECGYYWSTTWNNYDSSYPWDISFSSGQVHVYTSFSRYYGYPVRGIQ